jgi:hypothetical protein
MVINNWEIKEMLVNETDISVENLVRALQRNFPHMQHIKIEDEDSIYLGDGEIDGIAALDYFNEEYMYSEGVHRLLHTFLDRCGWYVEAETSLDFYAYRS